MHQAERLRDGYRYPFLLSYVPPIGTYSFLLLSSAFINCYDREMGFGTMKLLIDVILRKGGVAESTGGDESTHGDDVSYEGYSWARGLSGMWGSARFVHEYRYELGF